MNELQQDYFCNSIVGVWPKVELQFSLSSLSKCAIVVLQRQVFLMNKISV
jgi:hypothetical protein